MMNGLAIVTMLAGAGVLVVAGCDSGDGGNESDTAQDDGTLDTAGEDSSTDPPLDSAADPADAPDGDGPTDGIWRPEPHTSWQIQFTGALDTSLPVQMYDIDLFDTDTATIAGLQAAGKAVVCYFSAGSYEVWRPDEADFPASALGNDLDGWPGERWLDTRDAEVRAIMGTRLDLAAEKGCDGVDPDNVDGYTNDPGFPLTPVTQLDYNTFLANEAHSRGLGIGLKNDLDQIDVLLPMYDWALNEECFTWEECYLLLPFIESGKAVFQIEYGSASLAGTICPQANTLGFDTLIKNMDLDAWAVPCW